MSGWQSIRAWSVTAGGVVASLALVACTGDAPAAQPDPPEPTDAATSQWPTDDATDEPTDDPTAEPSEPPIAEPELPTAATKPTRQGAEAFVEYYVELMNYAKSNGAVVPLLRASSECLGCQEYAELYNTVYADGGFYTGMSWSLKGVTLVDGRPGYFALLQVRAAAGAYAESGEAKERKFESDSFDVRFHIESANESWRVTEIVPL